jgi:hypothetical protein
MTTQRLTRDWRLPTAGLMLLAILFAGFTLHAHWNAFIQWCLATNYPAPLSGDVPAAAE